VNPSNRPINTRIQSSWPRPRLKAIAQSMISRDTVHPARSVRARDRCRHFQSEGRGRVRRSLATSIAGNLAPARFPTSRSRAILGPARPSAAGHNAIRFIRAGSTRTLNSVLWQRFADDLTTLAAAGTSGPVWNALCYVILRSGRNRGTPNAAGRPVRRPSQSLRERRRWPSPHYAAPSPKI